MVATMVVMAALTLAGCGLDDAGGDVQRLEKQWEPLTLAAGQEETSLCASWTLGNDAPAYVRSVEMTSGPGWHHSNWFFVPADKIAVGPDGIWPCDERHFDQIEAGLAGGVLFAQSTGASHEIQAFPSGAALEVPAGARVVGQLHLLNAADRSLTTSIQLAVETIPAGDVTAKLAPFVAEFRPLAIPPGARSRFTASCEMYRPDFHVYYVLPHYHGLGVEMTVEAYGGAGDREIFRSGAVAGEPLGGVLDPPFDTTGASGIRFSCTYQNPTDRTVGYGNGDGEMCILLAYTDDRKRWAGGALFGEPRSLGVAPDGTLLFDAHCGLLGLPIR